MPRVFKRPAAWDDLVEHYVYLAENAGTLIADRFQVDAEASFADLAEHPAMGAPLTLRLPELTSLRIWRVKDFEHFLIFYLPRRDGATIVRILHASEDWWRTLGVEPAP
jgi:toxin ParE1/3/4